MAFGYCRDVLLQFLDYYIMIFELAMGSCNSGKRQIFLTICLGFTSVPRHHF